MWSPLPDNITVSISRNAHIQYCLKSQLITPDYQIKQSLTAILKHAVIPATQWISSTYHPFDKFSSSFFTSCFIFFFSHYALITSSSSFLDADNAIIHFILVVLGCKQEAGRAKRWMPFSTKGEWNVRLHLIWLLNPLTRAWF